jgi:hypothetical protein
MEGGHCGPRCLDVCFNLGFGQPVVWIVVRPVSLLLHLAEHQSKILYRGREALDHVGAATVVFGILVVNGSIDVIPCPLGLLLPNEHLRAGRAKRVE